VDDQVDGKVAVLQAFFELAWADGSITAKEAEYLSHLAGEMDISLGARIPLLVKGLTQPATTKTTNLGELLTDEEERYQVAERLVTLCFLTPELSFKQTQTLASLALQLDIRAEELEEMRLRVC
jgi:hypothetical protein